jgi:hypothetical protein
MYHCKPDCPDYPGGCPWPGLATPPHCTFEDDARMTNA